MKNICRHILLPALIALMYAEPVSAKDRMVSVTSDTSIFDVTPGSVSAVNDIDTEMPQTLSDSIVDYGVKFPRTIYAEPYSWTKSYPDWKRLWVNTGVLVSAFVGTLAVLECLPEDATSWNRAELQKVPLFRRWHDHVVKEGPEWDHDKFYFNYILHPYAGAAYFMSARSCGFNFWQSFLYCTVISNVCWEYGIEAFMERPSIQDLFITPVVGSLIGEGFYKLKRRIIDNGYKLGGSSFWGGLVCFLIDPVNEVIDLFRGNPGRKLVKARKSYEQLKIESSIVPYSPVSHGPAFTLSVEF